MGSGTKYITSTIAVDLDKSRMVRDWGKGDARVELWADENSAHVWLETNGGPVASQDGVVDMLIECGMTPDAAYRVSQGDVDAAIAKAEGGAK